MMIEATAADIVYTDRVTGIGANFLGRSLAAASVPEQHGTLLLSEEARAWKTVWSAGHGVGSTQRALRARAVR
jgi:nitronate monooxygenase